MAELHACPNCGGRSDLRGECRDCRRMRIARREMRARPRPPLVWGLGIAQVLLGVAAAVYATMIFLRANENLVRRENIAGLQAFVLYLVALPIPAIALGAGMLFPSRGAWVLSIVLQVACLTYVLSTDALMFHGFSVALAFVAVPVAFLVGLILGPVRRYYAKPEVSDQEIVAEAEKGAGA